MSGAEYRLERTGHQQHRSLFQLNIVQSSYGALRKVVNPSLSPRSKEEQRELVVRYLPLGGRVAALTWRMRLYGSLKVSGSEIVD
jgi:hypothetical protein